MSSQIKQISLHRHRNSSFQANHRTTFHRGRRRVSQWRRCWGDCEYHWRSTTTTTTIGSSRKWAWWEFNRWAYWRIITPYYSEKWNWCWHWKCFWRDSKRRAGVSSKGTTRKFNYFLINHQIKDESKILRFWFWRWNYLTFTS